MGERSHDGTDGTPTGAVSGAEGREQSAAPHGSRGLEVAGVGVGGQRSSGTERFDFPGSPVTMVLIITPYRPGSFTTSRVTSLRTTCRSMVLGFAKMVEIK